MLMITGNRRLPKKNAAKHYTLQGEQQHTSLVWWLLHVNVPGDIWFLTTHTCALCLDGLQSIRFIKVTKADSLATAYTAPTICQRCAHFSPQDNQALRQPYILGTIIITSITEEETEAGNNIM